MGVESDDHGSVETCQVFYKVMTGDARVDLSALPREWREAVERARKT
jgi:hypothetical protein